MVRELPLVRIASESIVNGSYMHNYPKNKFPESCMGFLEEISPGELEMCPGFTSEGDQIQVEIKFGFCLTKNVRFLAYSSGIMQYFQCSELLKCCFRNNLY